MIEKKVSVNGREVNYKIAGQGQTILILHGWGSSSDSWLKVQNALAEHGMQVYSIDLPGFGKTHPPESIWGVKEYADFIKSFVDAVKLSNFILLGHSFGGQVASMYAILYPQAIKKLVLCSAAAIRRSRRRRDILIQFFAKFIGIWLYLVPFDDLRSNIKSFLYMRMKRGDYIRAQGIMRHIFKKVIRQDLSKKLEEINVPTVVIWGNKDILTPIEDGREIHAAIRGSQMIVFKEMGHNPQFEMPEKLAETIVKVI